MIREAAPCSRSMGSSSSTRSRAPWSIFLRFGAGAEGPSSSLSSSLSLPYNTSSNASPVAGFVEGPYTCISDQSPDTRRQPMELYLIFPVLVVTTRVLLSLRTFLTLLDIYEHFCSLLLPGALVNVVPTEPTQHPLENMPHFRFEVIFVVVRPAEERGNKILEMWAEEVCGEGVNGELDVAQGGFDYLAVGRGQEDEEGREYLALHSGRDGVYSDVVNVLYSCWKLEKLRTFELEDETRYSGHRCTDHVRSSTSQTSRHHRHVLLDARHGCSKASANWKFRVCG